jgi:hypothetical protein
MNAFEMQVTVRQLVDKINSQRADGLLDSEVDRELNLAMQRFINQRYGRNNIYGEGFEESQKRIDELRTLVREYEDGVTFKEELKPGKVWVDSFKLPADYMYLVNQRSSIYLDKCKSLSNFNLEGQPNIYYYILPKAALMVTGASFPESIRIQDTDGGVAPLLWEALVWEPSNELLTSGYTSSQYPQYMQQVVDDMQENAQPGFQISWETLGPLSFPNHFIVSVDIATYPNFHWDGSTGTPTPLVMIGAGNTQASWYHPRIEDRSAAEIRVPSGDFTKDQVINKFSQQDDIFRLLDDPFNTTKPSEVLTTIRQDFIDVYTSAIFITEKVKITYIRKPAPISLPLNYDCELPEHTHSEIVSMAASNILEEISDPRSQKSPGELSNRE